MKLFNKATALSLVLVLLIGGLISCGPKVESYKATVTTSFSSNDAEMAEAIAALEKSEVTLSVYGDSIEVASSTKIGDIEMNKIYVVKDGVLYNDTTLKAEGKTAIEKEKAPFKESNRSELLAKVGAGAELDTNDFTKVVESKEKKITAYTCSGIKDDAKASLEAIFAAKFESLDADFSMLDAEYYVEKKDGKPVSYILNSRCLITIGDASYSVNMTIEADYDYDSKVEINAPDAAGFKETSYEDII